MASRTIETDYLVIGCGAAGMAFTDSLIGASKAQVVMVDRRHAPGGHWLEAYPFVRLHQPSAYYGVDSRRGRSKEPDIVEWLDRARLNASRGLRKRRDEPRVQQAWARFTANVRPALANLEGLLGAALR